MKQLLKNQFGSAVLVTITAACSGPAGVAPTGDAAAVTRACVIDGRSLQGLKQLTVEAGACPQLTLTGDPLVIDGDQSLVLANAQQVVISGKLVVDGQLSFSAKAYPTPFKLPAPTDQLQVNGALQLSGVNVSGAGAFLLGSPVNSPRSVHISNSDIGTDESGAAPTVSFFGATTSDCSQGSRDNPFTFENVTIRETAGHSLAFHHLPASTAGLTFAAADDHPFAIDLGQVCIPKNQDYELGAIGARYETSGISVSGSLSLNGGELVIYGDSGLIVDGGTLNSRGKDSKLARITFSSKNPQASKKIHVRNQGNASLQHTHVKGGAISVKNSDLTLTRSKVETQCQPPKDKEHTCESAEDTAAIIAEGDSAIDVADSELLPKTKTQVLVQNNGPKKPRLSSSGHSEEFQAATMDGQPFPVHRLAPIIIGNALTPLIHAGLFALNGTFEGPCITPPDSKDMSLRRSFIFDNAFITHNDPSLFYTSVHFKVTRIQINYIGPDCDTATHTSATTGTATYYVLTGKPDGSGVIPEALTNRVFFAFNQLVWTYHDQNMLTALNNTKDGLCGMRDWAAGVPKDITRKECFGTVIRIPNYHDRFRLDDQGHLQLALDYDDRPEGLKDVVPRDINQKTTYIRK